jgi:glycosyltransferase involved in cell wall biosynthesis
MRAGDHRLTVLLVIGTLQLGGTERQVCRLARELSAAGHNVTVFALASGGPLAEELDRTGIPWQAFGYQGLSFHDARRRLRPWMIVAELAKLARLGRAIRRLRPDVCHTFLFWANVLALPLATAARVPVRVSGRRGLARSLPGKRGYRRLQRLSNRCAHAIVANSVAVADDAVQYERPALGKVHVIANGVDVAGATAPVERCPPTGLIVANLLAYKGHQDLVDALRLLDRPPRIRAVGEGPERDRLEAVIRRYGLGAALVLEGAVPQTAPLFQQVQFGVLASHDEGLPNAVMEAMAAGVPMVATAVGGVPELIEHGRSGLVVPPRDPRALAAAIHRLASDPALRVRLGSAARARITEFSWPVCLGAHLRLYQGLLSRG